MTIKPPTDLEPQINIEPQATANRQMLFRFLPAVDALLRAAYNHAPDLSARFSPSQLTVYARSAIDNLRRQMSIETFDSKENFDATNEADLRAQLLRQAHAQLSQQIERASNSDLRRVINATGVVLHTNLGRAPLSLAARKRILEAASYCTLEYDLESGERGRRGAGVEDLLCELTNAEAAFVVNNCAAATMLILAALARDGETIISRGELVAIGGDFRIPDVMGDSGTQMREVGTTNRTTIDDYARAVNANTKLIARVHPSNYRVVGFTHTPQLAELAELARERNLILYEDAGSGALFDMSEFGLTDEPIIPDSIKAGADIVSFSGDKLLGGAQAGCIVGRENLINVLRRAPLARALRIDKLSLAALEATLESHRRGAALKDVPVLNMIAMTPNEIAQRTQTFIEPLRATLEAHGFAVEIIDGTSAIGGGSAPLTHPPTKLIALTHRKHSPAQLAHALRRDRSDMPTVIARIADNRLLLDLRTVAASEEVDLQRALIELNKLSS